MTLLLYAIRVIFTRLMSGEPNLHYAALLTDFQIYIDHADIPTCVCFGRVCVYDRLANELRNADAIQIW